VRWYACRSGTGRCSGYPPDDAAEEQDAHLRQTCGEAQVVCADYRRLRQEGQEEDEEVHHWLEMSRISLCQVFQLPKDEEGSVDDDWRYCTGWRIFRPSRRANR